MLSPDDVEDKQTAGECDAQTAQAADNDKSGSRYGHQSILTQYFVVRWPGTFGYGNKEIKEVESSVALHLTFKPKDKSMSKDLSKYQQIISELSYNLR